MSGPEYRELMLRLDRMERLLSRLVGDELSQETAQAPVAGSVSELAEVRTIQEEGHYILATQGRAAYKKFWQEQSKKAGKKPRLRSAA